MKFISPKNDVAFKKIFGNEDHPDILISFLNAVLKLEGDRTIQSVELINTAQLPKIDVLKLSHLDIRARDKRGVTFIIEMQVEPVKGYQKRFLYYASKAYSGQIERDEDYPRLNQVIFIGVLNFVAFNSKNFITRHLILNTENSEQDMDGIEFNFIELPKFTKSDTELTTDIDKWVYFVKHVDELQAIPDHSNEPPIRTAYDIANRFSWSKEELDLYDYAGIRMQDEIGRIQYAEERAEKRGIDKGERAANEATAQRMLAKGFSPEEVSDMTGLQVEEVIALVHV